MYEIQKFDVSPRIILRKTPMERVKTRIRNSLLGLGIDFHGWREITEAYTNRANVKGYVIAEGVLDDAQIEAVAEYAEGRAVDYMNTLAPLTEDEARQTVQYTTIPLMEELIRQDGNIRTVADLGCYSARVFGLLPPRHTGIRFDFVDFMKNVAELNAGYAGPNTRFFVDYPLRFLQTSEEIYDVVHFNRVLALIGRDEIREYFRVLREKARFVVWGEPAKILGMRGDLNLDNVEDFVQFPGYRTYNYRKLLEEAGFELLHYDAVRTSPQFSGEQHFIIRGVATANADQGMTGAS